MRRLPWLLLILALISPIDPATVRAEVVVDSFRDDDNSRFEPFIETASAHGIVTGCNPPKNDLVCPHHLLTTGQMAAVVARAWGDAAARKARYITAGALTEVAVTTLRAAGVDVVCDDKGVCADRLISRGEMAALIAEGLGWKAGGNAGYSDISGNRFEKQLSALAARGGLLPCDEPVNSRLCPSAAVRRDEAALAVVAAMGLLPAIDVPDAPETTALDFGDSFDELDLWDGGAPSSRNRVSLTDDGYDGSALRVSIPKGSHFGADFELPLDGTVGETPEHLFFRYFLRFDRDWATTHSGKLPGFSGVYGSTGKGGFQSSAGEPGWSARLMFSPASAGDGRVPIGYYVYHLGQATEYGDGVRWNEAGRLNPGEWYCLEGEIELNRLGVADGALRAWIDETPALDFSGLVFRRPEEPQVKIESFWFDVYYGGKPVAPQSLGLTIDEVAVDTNRIGCDGGGAVKQQARGDLNGDGYDDRIWWDACPVGTCFWEESLSAGGGHTRDQVGTGAWFNLESHRLGLAAGDLNGDGRDDLIYRGRCAGSLPCWRAHLSNGRGLGTGQDWGDDGRFSSRAATLVAGDWNGDGRDDIVYQGVCGSAKRECWRAHISTGTSFSEAQDGGASPGSTALPIAADVNGDELDDLVYRGPCDEGECWFSQVSDGVAFAAPSVLGDVVTTENSLSELIDFNRDGRVDLVSYGNDVERSTITVRLLGDDGFSDPIRVARFDGAVSAVSLRQVADRSPVEAVVHVECGTRKTCVETLVASSNRLADPADYTSQREAAKIPDVS